MSGSLRSLFKDAAVYGIASGLSRFVKVLLVPIVARAVPASEFGAFDSVTIYSFVAAMAAVIGLDSAVVLLARREGTSVAEGRRVAGSGYLAVLAAGAGLAAVGMAAPATWSRLLLDTPAYAGVITWAALGVPFAAILMYVLGLLKWEFRRRWFLAASLGSAAASVGLTWYAAVHTSTGLAGLMAATTAGQAAGAILGTWAVRDLLDLRWNAAAGRRLLALGVPFAVIGVAGSAAPSVDRLFLAHAHTLVDAGIYAVGQRIAMLQALVLGGFQAAWGPFAFSMARSPEKSVVFGRVLLLVASVGGALTLLLVLCAPWLARVAAGDAYAGAGVYVAPLGLSATLGAGFFVVSIGAFLEERTVYNLYAYAAGLAVTLGLNVGLAATDASPIGIAWANCLGQLTAVVLMAHLSHRVHPLPYPFAKGLAVLTACGVAGTLLAARPPGSVAGSVAAAGAITLLSAAWIWLEILSPRARQPAGRGGAPTRGD